MYAFLILSFGILYKFWRRVLIRFYNYFLPHYGLSFYFCNGVLQRADILKLVESILSVCSFMDHAFSVVSKKFCLVSYSCLTFCNSMACSLPGSSLPGISQVWILERLPFPSPGDLPGPGIKPAYLVSPALAGSSLPPCYQGNTACSCFSAVLNYYFSFGRVFLLTFKIFYRMAHKRRKKEIESLSC